MHTTIRNQCSKVSFMGTHTHTCVCDNEKKMITQSYTHRDNNKKQKCENNTMPIDSLERMQPYFSVIPHQFSNRRSSNYIILLKKHSDPCKLYHNSILLSPYLPPTPMVDTKLFLLSKSFETFFFIFDAIKRKI